MTKKQAFKAILVIFIIFICACYWILSRNIAKNPNEEAVKAYKEELFDAQTTCNSVIPQKFGKLLAQYEPKKLVMLGYKDETLGQLGYKGSQKQEFPLLDKGIKFRWSWSLQGSDKFIKCLIKDNGKYSITLEKY